MMADLGWYYQDTKLDEMKIADQVMPPPTFRKAKSDWAFVPEFPQTCCYGVLGQDFLSRFKIRFEPRKPTHVEWDDLELPLKSYPPSKLLLSPLFNLRSDVVTYQKKKLDLADVAYDLNLSKKELILEPFVPTEKQKRARREKPIFTFSIMPPIRILKITSIDPSVQKAAKAIGIKIGSVIWAVENESVIFLDQFYVERALKGRSDSKLELLISDSLKLTKRRTVFFDFEKSEFSEPLPEKNPEAPVPDPATKVLQKALDDTKK